jgi:hypothetical protein
MEAAEQRVSSPTLIVVRDDVFMQGRPLDERELLDAESVAGHLVEVGSS